MEEVWRISPTVPVLMVSSHGRIMIVPRVGPMPHGGKRHYETRPYPGVWSETDKRYIIIIDGKTYKVARLICEAFNGTPPIDKPVCMHLDENSRNNRPDNLAWGTQKENLNAPKYLEYRRSRTGENSSRVKGRMKAA